ncbi:MAG: phosphoadenylyl-sulfate reductase [Hyphomicrobiales bacterium]|nr:phosphoadenylyl-sulfate reductase [Hyphomicrobiales bacterium]
MFNPAPTARPVRADLFDRLSQARAATQGRAIFTTSFGIEDQAITHAIFEGDISIEVVTLDTGRLFPETYALWAKTEARYGRRIRSFNPDAARIESLVAEQGIDGFYHAIEARKACCNIRKVEPLKRALAGASLWITGLRAEQSDARSGVPFLAQEASFDILKANPLHDWTRDDVVAYTRAHGVPVNTLHAQGFPSIGCAPCTRAIAPGEPERAGRWWWEQASPKECGLHVGPDGRLQRATPARTEA